MLATCTALPSCRGGGLGQEQGDGAQALGQGLTLALTSELNLRTFGTHSSR